MTPHAVLITDVVDSTRLAGQMGDARAAETWAEYDRRARELLNRFNGREISRTDGFLLLFDDARDAASYALAYHQAMSDLAFLARAGLHIGRVHLRENAPDDVARGAKPTEVEGLAKPFAARLMALARGGQTLLSAAAREALGDTLPVEAAIESHGHYRLKGIDSPVEVFELGVRGIAPFAPPTDAEKAYRVVRSGDLWHPVREVRHNLPAERDAFVGRIAELHALASRLDAGARLLTVLGPGGSGKTRFVRRYGWTWLGDWPGGIYFCDLSEAASFDGVLFAVASALDVPLGKDNPAVQLGHAIAGRGRCLVILDNFEQVVALAPGTLGRWLDRAVDAAFVVTSRERLHLAGEEIFPIEPLSLDKDAMELFVTRARAQRHDFALSESNLAAVAEVVRLLDGLPLAIELAAARTRVLSPAQLVERLRDRFQLLAGARGAAARQATLRAAIDWSWDLLAPSEQAALAQCSVFEGGFTMEAAEAVVDLSPWRDAQSPLDVVQALVDKSLLRTWVPAAQGRYDIDEPYFGMYVSIHEYAREKLTANARDAKSAEERHGRYFASLGTEGAIEALYRHGGVRLGHALVLELDNLVAACRRAVARNDGTVAVGAYCAAWEVLDFQGPFALGITLGAQVLGIGELAGSLRAAALAAHAHAARLTGRMEEAGTELAQALALSRELRDRRLEGTLLVTMADLLRLQGHVERSMELLQTALAIARETGNRCTEGIVLANVGRLHMDQGRTGEAQVNYEAALAIHREVGNRRHEASVSLAVLYAEQGRLDEARTSFEQCLAINRELGDRTGEGEVLTNLGCLHQEQGRFDEAQAHYETSLGIHRAVGNRRYEGYVLGDLGRLHLQQGNWTASRACLDQALAITREVRDRRIEGSELRSLGDLFIAMGRIDEARAVLAEGEAVLRQMGDKFYLAHLLCGRAEVERRTGNLDAARDTFKEAESLAAATLAGPDSELGRKVSKLGEALG